MSNEFSANASALGYLHQVRYALHRLLNSDTDSLMSIELIDDVAMHADTNSTAEELLQLKHSIKQNASLTDSSAEIWKTFRVWLTLIENGEIVIDKVSLNLLTTSIALPNSAAAKLRFSPENRDVSGACSELSQAASSSTRKASDPVKQGMLAFEKLSIEEKKRFLNQVVFIDGFDDITEVRKKIVRQLRVATSERFVENFADRIEGWWFNKVVQHLKEGSNELISYRELQLQLNEIASQFQADNLPIEFLDAILPDENSLPQRDRLFIHQLRIVMVSDKRIAHALNDYFRAFQQRSKWIRDGFVGGEELGKYEKRLCEEWEEQFETMRERMESGVSPEQIEIQGRELYNQIRQNVKLNIRPKCSEPYVMMGSFHMLANKMQIGWHLEFLERLKHLVGEDNQ